MKEVLQELYQQLKERYGLMSKTWGDFHLNSLNQKVWFKEDGKHLQESFLDEYLIWNSLTPLFIEYGVSYAQDINDFLDKYYPVYRKVFVETNGSLMYPLV